MLTGPSLYTINAGAARPHLIENGYLGSRPLGRYVSGSNFTTEAAATEGFNSGGFSAGATVVGKNMNLRMLEGFLPDSPALKRQIYKDIYLHDPVCGGAVDILSTLPFSPFDIVGISDLEILEVYQRCCEMLRLKLLLPALSKEYLAMGSFVGTSVWNTRDRIFDAIMPQDLDSLEIKPVPFYGIDPIIDLKITPAMKKLMQDRDPRVQQIINNIPASMKENMRSGKIQLKPETTLFLPRRTLPSDSTGTSFYERVIGTFLLEKTLFRGTLDQAARRQRAILHLQIGDGDEWIPTQEDLVNVTNLFASADADPTGPIIATRLGIQPTEIREAESFFRVDSITDYTTTTKYRALGISEEMVTGQMTLSTMEASLSVFSDQLREYRGMLTREIFYEKIFPALAVARNFRRGDYETTGSRSAITGARHDRNGNPNRIWRDYEGNYRARADDSPVSLNIKNTVKNMKDYLIPRIEWEKHLKAEADDAYLGILSTLQERGVPVPLTMWAAAGGVSMDAIINGADSDLKLRKRLASYMKQVAKLNAASGLQSSESAAMLASLLKKDFRGKNYINRDYGDLLEPHEIDKNGRYKTVSSRRKREIRERTNKMAAEVMAKLGARHNAKLRHNKKKPKIIVHARMGVIK